MTNRQLPVIDKQKLDDAVSVIHSLIQGIHPVTKQALANDSVMQDMRVVRALFGVQQCLLSVQLRVERRSLSAGGQWSATEDAQLRGRFQDGRSIDYIASKHARSPADILARLDQLGLITAEQCITGRAFGNSAARHRIGEAW